jgi:hypothetical protein
MSEPVKTNKEWMAYRLEVSYPWLSESLSLVLVNKLNRAQVQLLLDELQYTAQQLLKSEAKRLLAMNPAERISALEEQAKWEE